MANQYTIDMNAHEAAALNKKLAERAGYEASSRDYAEFCYKVTDFYHPGDEDGLLYNDPALGVEWPIPEGMELILSEKDTKHESFERYLEKYCL